MLTFAGNTAPTGWLQCNGAAVSRTTYARLFSVIGTTYGAGDGSTTFNLPNTGFKNLSSNLTVEGTGADIQVIPRFSNQVQSFQIRNISSVPVVGLTGGLPSNVQNVYFPSSTQGTTGLRAVVPSNYFIMCIKY